MDNDYLQQQRFLLQKKIKRLNSCNEKIFHSLFLQFWGYLNSHNLFSGVLQKLANEAPKYVDELSRATRLSSVEWKTEQESLHFNFRLMEYCAAQPLGQGNGPAASIGRSISRSSKIDECLESFRDTYLEPFYEFLDESIDGQAAVVSLLLKYKRHVEWFEREELAGLIAKGGERSAAKHMYAYLFDQGLDFYIEPQSVSGEADLIAKDLVLDAKIFDTSRRGKSYILAGVNQILTYLRDYQQQTGYLAIYRTCPEDLQFSFSRSDMLVPSTVIDGRIIYFLVIDVCDYGGVSASKRGALKAHMIDEQNVRTVIQDLEEKLETGSH